MLESLLESQKKWPVNRRKSPRFNFSRDVATTLSKVDTRVVDLSSNGVLLNVDQSKLGKILPIWIKPVDLRVNWTIQNVWIIKRAQMLNPDVIELAVEFKQKVEDRVFWDFLWQYWWNRVEKNEEWKVLGKYKISWKTIQFEWKALANFVREVMNLVKTWLYDTIDLTKMEKADTFIYSFLAKTSETTNIKIIYNWNDKMIIEYLTLFKVPYTKK